MSERIYRNSNARSSHNHLKPTPENRHPSQPYYSNDRSNLSIEELDSEDEFIFNLAGISQYSDTYIKSLQQDRVAYNELDAGESKIAQLKSVKELPPPLLSKTVRDTFASYRSSVTRLLSLIRL